MLRRLIRGRGVSVMTRKYLSRSDYEAMVAGARRTVELTGVRQSTILIDALADALELLLGERDSLARLHDSGREEER